MIRLILAAALLAVPNTPDPNQFSVAGWEHDRVNQRAHIMDGKSWNGKDYGAGITVYVVDSGVYDSGMFRGGVEQGFNAFSDGKVTCGAYHGSMIASIIAGRNLGLAQKAKIVSVRVMNCAGKGNPKNIIAGLDWILQNADPGTSVVNMSISGAATQSLDDKVNEMVDAGFPVVVASGNDGRDACRYSPGRADGALTIGASTRLDLRSRSSNIGPCISLYAPGENITVYHPLKGQIKQTGTSGAAAFVSGAIAATASMYGLETYDAMSVLFLGTTVGAICCGYRTTSSDLLYLNTDLYNVSDGEWWADWWD